MNRASRFFIPVTIGLIIVALIAAAYGRYSYRRPLPQTDGAVLIVGLQENVNIYRDEWGIPNIYAGNTHDLFFAQGYVHAQDRWWQMEIQRHLATGQLSEILGEDEAVQNLDRLVRTLGWHTLAEANWQVASEDTRTALQAYADGVNAYIQEQDHGDLAMQYALLDLTGRNYEIRAWTPIDSLARAISLAWMMDGNLSDELQRTFLMQTLDPVLLEDYLVPPDWGGLQTSIIGHQDYLTDAATPEFPPIVPPTLDIASLNLQIIGDIEPDNLPYLGKYASNGSNSWVIDGNRSASRLPLIASDVHITEAIPALWYEVGLRCIEITAACPYNVAGYSVPGLPAIFSGHNDMLAWTLTPAHLDVQDAYAVQIQGDQYWFEGAWHALQFHEETLLINGVEEPFIWTVYSTHLGPIITENNESGHALALRWTGSEAHDPLLSLLKMNAAATRRDFLAALSQWQWAAQDVLYATHENEIGYQLVGNIPIRTEHHSGLMPATVDDNWLGYMPFNLLPSLQNPADGWIIVAGQPIAPPSYATWLADQMGQAGNYLMLNAWGTDTRAQQLQTALVDADAHTVESFQIIQGDSYTGFGQQLVALIQTIDFPFDPDDEEAPSLETIEHWQDYQAWLAEWDYHSTAESPYAALVNAFWANLSAIIFDDEFEFPRAGTAYERHAIFNLPPDSAWWDDRLTEDIIEDRDSTLRNAFIAAIAEMEDQLGEIRSDWAWGDLHEVKFTSIPLGDSTFGDLVNSDAVATGGDVDAINSTAWRTDEDHRYQVTTLPTYRLIIDLGDLGNKRSILATGESGHPASKNYADMIDLWRSLAYHETAWDIEVVEERAASTLRLRPDITLEVTEEP